MEDEAFVGLVMFFLKKTDDELKRQMSCGICDIELNDSGLQ